MKESLESANAESDQGAVQPSFAVPVSQLVTALQFLEPEFKRWALHEMGWQFGFNRKVWEYAYILQALHFHGKLGGKGLGFGVGREPIVPVLLRHGATLVASDLADEEAQSRGWESMRFEVADTSRLAFRFVDMNDIPSDLRGFDFLWSCGSLEHIGGLENGIRFVERAMDCLRPGGLAVHTTEFTLTSNEHTYESPELSFYRQRDIESLAARLRRAGHAIELNFARGWHPVDGIVCTEQSPWEFMVRAAVAGHTITSIGLIIRKA